MNKVVHRQESLQHARDAIEQHMLAEPAKGLPDGFKVVAALIGFASALCWQASQLLPAAICAGCALYVLCEHIRIRQVHWRWFSDLISLQDRRRVIEEATETNLRAALDSWRVSDDARRSRFYAKDAQRLRRNDIAIQALIGGIVLLTVAFFGVGLIGLLR